MSKMTKLIIKTAISNTIIILFSILISVGTSEVFEIDSNLFVVIMTGCLMGVLLYIEKGNFSRRYDRLMYDEEGKNK